MGIGAKLDALQVTPLVAHGAEGTFRTVLHDLNRFGQAGLVVHVEGDEHVVVVDEVGHLHIGPDSKLHLAAIDTAVAGKVEHHRLAVFTGILHAGIVVVELGMNLIIIEIEVLRLHGRCKGTDRLQRSTPQTGHHVNGESQRSQCQEEAGHADLGVIVVVRELDLTQKIEAQQGEEHDPQSQEGLTIEDTPAVCQVGHGKEFQRKSQFKETQRHLDDIHPTARLRHGLQPRGEEGKERERQCQSNGKSQHTYSRSNHIACSRHLYQQETDDGTRAGEGHQRQREGHQEYAQ